MSRLGKLPVAVPDKVEVAIEESRVVVKGPKGELSTIITGDVNVTLDNGEVWVKPANDSKRSREMWGTVRANIRNLVQGVTTGYERALEINGVGFRCAIAKNVLTLQLGYSHEIRYIIPAGVECEVEKQTAIKLKGADKILLGKVASDLRRLRKPEPYKGKGVKYAEEIVRRKEGKKK